MRRKSELERQGKRSTTHDDDEVDSDESFAAREQLSTIVPSYETSAYVEGLLPASVYLVEVRNFLECLPYVYKADCQKCTRNEAAKQKVKFIEMFGEI